MNRKPNEVSLVYWYPNLERHLCGYCKNGRGNISHGMWAEQLSCDDYQNLIDRGWRRSGKYCYKPVMDQICCPTYTIKCDVVNFQMSKSQKKVMKKFNKHLNDGILNKTESQQEAMESSDGISEIVFREAPSHLLKPENLMDAVDCIDSGTTLNVDNEPSQSTSEAYSDLKVQETSKEPDKHKSSVVGADPTKPPCKKAKILRLERKQEKLLKQGKVLQPTLATNEQKSLEAFLTEISQDSKHKFKLELINTCLRGEDWEKVKNVEFALYKKYQTIVHNDPPSKCSMESFIRFLVKSPLQITLERISKDHDHFDLTSELWARYQIAVHNDAPDECGPVQYHDFLIETPLLYVGPSSKSEVGFGSFHQLYWLDDKLIAVGVIDVLPKCVSAVYFFYDPDYRSLTLGTYGSLREVEFVRSLNRKSPSIRHYYMGYYIHTCQKMRYKGKLLPSFLLCPETYQWVPIERCIGKLEVDKYSRLAEATSVDENKCSAMDVANIKIVLNGKVLRYSLYRSKSREDTSEYETISQLIGKACAKTLLFIEK